MKQEKSEQELFEEKLKEHKSNRRKLQSALKVEEEKMAELEKNHKRPYDAGRP